MFSLFLTGGWNANVGSKVIPGMKGKFGLGEQNEAGQRLTEFFQENRLVIDGEGHSTPLQYSCLENPVDGGAWWATVHGVTKS